MSDSFVTETLAKLYEDHGALDKAKEVYRLLHQQHPDRTDFESKVTELDSQVVQSSQPPTDYRTTLDQGLANNQDGMPLDTALDEFEDHQAKPKFDPAVLDQIMTMTDMSDSVVPEAIEMEKNIQTPEVSNHKLSGEHLPKIVHKWIDLLMIKRKIDQLKQLKQKVH